MNDKFKNDGCSKVPVNFAVFFKSCCHRRCICLEIPPGSLRHQISPSHQNPNTIASDGSSIVLPRIKPDH